MTDSEQLQQVQADVSDHLTDIKRKFKPSSRIMLFVRQANDPEGKQDFVIGDDELPEIIKMCERRMAEAGR